MNTDDIGSECSSGDKSDELNVENNLLDGLSQNTMDSQDKE